MTPKFFMTGVVVAAVAATALSVEAARAETGPKDKDRTAFFDMIDSNGDGEVSLQEMGEMRKQRFAKADANGDGLLSRDEMMVRDSKRMQKRVDRMLERFDTNADGALSREEMPDRSGEMFARADVDSSGGLTREEMQQMHRHGKRQGDKN